jgi:hypothetical protein
VSGHAQMPPASHQVSATSLKLLIQQIHPHVRVERDSGMCVDATFTSSSVSWLSSKFSAIGILSNQNRDVLRNALLCSFLGSDLRANPLCFIYKEL